MSSNHLESFLQPEPNKLSEPTGGLDKRLEQVWEIASDFGMDPFPTHFDVIPPLKMHEIAATGLPKRFSHWTNGRAYRQMKTSHEYGMGKLYEIVINANPAQAYLLENNSDIENTVVMAHVLGHTEFFKHNRQFQVSRRDMPHAAANQADQIRQFGFQHGTLVVEKFLDAALSVARHIDPQAIVRPSKADQLAVWKAEFSLGQKTNSSRSEFADLFPEDRELDKKKQTEMSKIRMPIPLHPDRDLLGFIADYSGYLDDWQREILQIVRAESLYFHPQARTKIMNEGYASYWHKKIMSEMSNRGYLTQEDDFRWVAMHSGVVAPHIRQINPYHLGIEMFQYIEDVYNGQLSDQEKRYEERAEKPVFPKYEGDFVGSPGYDHVREAMMLDDDQSFIRNHFSQVVAERMNMYLYKEEGDSHIRVTTVADKDWERIRDSLVRSMDNYGVPCLEVVNSDYGSSRVLQIKHLYEGQELDPNYVKKTMPYIEQLWGRSVVIETVSESKKIKYVVDGSKVTKSDYR